MRDTHRFWSVQKIKDMATARGLVVSAEFLQELPRDRFNDLGDFLYYECHPDEPSSRRFVEVPDWIIPLLPRNWVDARSTKGGTRVKK